MEGEPLTVVMANNYGAVTDMEKDKATEEMKVTDPLTGSRTHQYMATIAATIGALGIGTVIGYSSPALPKMQQDTEIAVSDKDLPWIGSLANVGAMCGSLCVGFLLRTLGRKVTMLLLTIPSVIGWTAIVAANQVWMLCIGRTITGISAGAYSVAIPIYIAEISEADLRGRLMSYFQLLLTVGVLLVYGFGWVLSWRWLAAVCIIVPLVFVLVFSCMPESPSFLISNGDHVEAKAVLCKLRGSTHDIEEEVISIERQLQQLKQRKNPVSTLLHGVNSKLLVVSLGLMFFQMFSGISAVCFYSTNIFLIAGVHVNANIGALVIGVVQCLATYSSSLLVDRVGRKILLLFSGILMGTSLSVLSLCFGSNNFYTELLSLLPLSIYIIAFSVGFGPISWIMMGELFSMDIKELASSITASFNWFCSFVVTLSFIPLLEVIGASGVFWYFSTICFTSTMFVLFFVKETKGKSQEQILREYGGGHIDV